MPDDRLRKQIDFLMELDKLKTILRRSYLIADPDRHENSSEHSWHVTVMAAVLEEHCPSSIDVNRVLRMLLIHDIVEIDAGDISVYLRQNKIAVTEKEKKAARRIFGLLPDDQRNQFSELWNEFEAESTAEARFARVVDRLEPVIYNYYTRGKTWQDLGVTYDQVVSANQKIIEYCPPLWEFAFSLINESVAKGYLKK